MARLTIDDGFSRHPKVTALTAKERWVWLDVLCYCARYKTGGYLPESPGAVIAGASPKFVGRCGQLGLLNVTTGGRLRVHDWHIYNGSIAERVEVYLDDNPDASANEVQQAIGGTREIVMAEVRKLREVVRPEPAETPLGGSGRTTLAGSETGSESGSRARVPLPLKELTKAVPVARPDDATTNTDERPKDFIKDTISESLERGAA